MVIFKSNGCILTPAVEDAKEGGEGENPIEKNFNKILKNTMQLDEKNNPTKVTKRIFYFPTAENRRQASGEKFSVTNAR